MTTYYVCSGVVSIVGNGANEGLKCSTGWTQAVEPVFSTITVEQGRELFLALAALVVTIAIYRALARIF